jgi:SAM-dependent methyltransferase
MIQGAIGTQKVFNILDIGAGNFQWARSTAAFIENQIPGDVRVNFYSIRGENYLGERVVTNGKCTCYNIGSFKVEEILAQLQQHQLPSENSFDLITARWCFRHLVDPVGTFQQTYNLLRPGQGTLLMDGFLFAMNDQTMDWLNFNCDRNVMALLRDTGAPFLMNFESLRSFNHFILKRIDSRPCHLPLSYASHPITLSCGWDMSSGGATRFTRDPQPTDNDYIKPPSWPNVHHGDLQLYTYLEANGLLTASREERPRTWKALT